MTRTIGTLVCACLVLSSPGPSAYAAMARSSGGGGARIRVVPRVAPSSVRLPVGGSSPVNRGIGAPRWIPGLPGTATSRPDAVPAKLDSSPQDPTHGPAGWTGRTSGSKPSEATTAPTHPGDELPNPEDYALESVEAETMGRPSRIGFHLMALRQYFAPRKTAEADGLEPRGTVMGAMRGLAASSPEGRLGDPSVHRPLALDFSPLGGESRDVPGPPKVAEPAKGKSGWFGLGSVAAFFLAAAVVGQVGVESQGAVLPALLQNLFKDFTMATELTIAAKGLGFFGRMLAPKVIARLGLKWTYLGATLLRVASVTALALLLASGHMTVLPLFIFFSINGFLEGIAVTAESSIGPEIVGQDQDRLESLSAWQQFLLETIGIAGPIATGALLGSGAVGYTALMWVFPATFVAAILILFFTLKLPRRLKEKVELMDKADKARAPPKRSVAHGARLVWGDPVLKVGFLAYTAYMMLNPFLYGILANAYGIRLVGADNEVLAAGVYTMLTGLYSLGGLIAGVLMLLEGRSLKAAMNPPEGSGRAPISREAVKERLRRSMLRYMKWGTAALALVAALAFPSPLLSSLVTLPGWLSWLGAVTIPALALIPFGIVQVASMLKIRSFFQSQVPLKDMPDAMGFLGAVSLAVSTLGLLLLKFMFGGITLFGFNFVPAFKGLQGFAPFVVFAAAMIPLAIVYVALTRKLDKVSAPPSSPPK